MRGLTAAVAAILGALVLPAAAAAQAGTGSPPAGGGAIDQVIFGTIGGLIVSAAMAGVIYGHRTGKLKQVGQLAGFSERVSGLPGWTALPLSIAAGSLIIAVLGMYWDISIHIDQGRDEGPFANTSHFFILIGLFGITFSGLLAMALPKERPGPTAVKLPNGWQVPLGGLLMFVCSAFALSAFPMDDIWHRIFGQDVTLWGPTHLVLFGAAALSTLGILILVTEGFYAANRDGLERKPVLHWLIKVSLGGAFLIALSTFQGEFDYAVPQFRIDWHPILLAMAASIGLVAARVWIGPGGAIGAALFFLLIRGFLSLWVGPITGHTPLHFPLYIVEALLVEIAARFVPRDRPLTLGAISGVLIGTIGAAAETVWSYVSWVLPWKASMLPEAAIATLVMAIAGGVIGGFVGRSLASPWVKPALLPRFVVPAAALAALAVFIYAGPIPEGDKVSAQITLEDVKGPPEREVNATVRLDPPDAAEDNRWLTLTSWQGKQPSVVDKLEKVPGEEGVYRSTKPIPVHGNWKTTLRLHKGAHVQGLAVYFPEDEAIPAPAVVASPQFERSFQQDKKLLQREQKKGVSPVLTVGAYIIVLLIALGLVASLARGLKRMERASAKVRDMGQPGGKTGAPGPPPGLDGSDGDGAANGTRTTATRGGAAAR